MDEFDIIQNRISELIALLPSNGKRGAIEINESGGMSGYYVRRGFLKNRRLDLLGEELYSSPVVQELRRKCIDFADSSARQPYGPFYSVEIKFQDQNIEFEYFWMNDPELTPQNVKKHEHFGMPGFMFTRKFDRELIEASGDDEIYMSLYDVVYAAKRKKLHIHDDMVTWYAVYDMTTDVFNGGWDQYFRRVTDSWKVGEFSRLEMYRRVISAFERLGLENEKSLFEHLISLYAHVFDFVEEVRVSLELPKIEQQEESDALPELYEQLDTIQSKVTEAIRRNIDQYEVDFRAASDG